MPKATVSLDAQRFDLKSCPGAFVRLRPLSYGQKKDRADKAGQVWTELQQGRRGNNRTPSKMFMESMNRVTTQYDYEHCIVDHNLEDDNGGKLDFGNSAAIDVLNPRIGQEIEDLMAELNGDDEDMVDFFSRSDDSQHQDKANLSAEQ